MCSLFLFADLHPENDYKAWRTHNNKSVSYQLLPLLSVLCFYTVQRSVERQDGCSEWWAHRGWMHVENWGDKNDTEMWKSTHVGSGWASQLLMQVQPMRVNIISQARCSAASRVGLNSGQVKSSMWSTGRGLFYPKCSIDSAVMTEMCLNVF